MSDRAILTSDGGIAVKNRAMRRNFKNRAQLEGRSSKKWYTKKKVNKKQRRKNAKNSR